METSDIVNIAIKKEKLQVFSELLEAELKYYNATCNSGFELTMEDVIRRLEYNSKIRINNKLI
jgi:ribonucleotide reductase beta subunit family protein with ferritin-like domain